MRKHIFYKWSDLTDQQKSENTEKTEVLFSFCEKNPGITVTYEQMNKMGLNRFDYKTDYILRRELKKYTSTSTNIIVAQRIGTIINSDMIIVLDKGVVVGKGTHKELMALGRKYATLHKYSEQ